MTPYPIPEFVKTAGIDQAKYKRWLDRKALAHALRDSERWDIEIKVEEYRKAIHRAVVDSNGIDAYTKEPLEWSLISTYLNHESRLLRSEYRKRFTFLPTVDHEDGTTKTASFKICGLRTNDCKSHLTVRELKEFCRLILENE